MEKIVKNIRGLILAEALVAAATLVSGVIIVGIITSNAITTTVVSEDYLVAQNLLIEGEEILKVIRNTNWMNFPDDKTCWLTKGKNCSPSSKIAAVSTYTPIFENGGWKLTSNSDCSAADFTTKPVCSLSLKSMTLLDGTTFQQYIPYEASLDKSKFYRAIKAIEVSSNQSKATFEIRIQWNDGAKLREIKRLVHLFNHVK